MARGRTGERIQGESETLLGKISRWGNAAIDWVTGMDGPAVGTDEWLDKAIPPPSIETPPINPGGNMPGGWTALPGAVWNLGKSVGTTIAKDPVIRGRVAGAIGLGVGAGAATMMNGNGYVPQGPVMPGASPLGSGVKMMSNGAGAIGPGMCPPGSNVRTYQSCGKRKLYPYSDPFGNVYWRTKPRRMNPLNFSALKRAQKRMCMFEDVVKSVITTNRSSSLKRPKRRRSSARRRKCRR